MTITASAEGKRIALVIGNSAYSATTQLPNAIPDARAFAIFLQENGFEVDHLVDANRSEIAQGLSNFTREIGPGDTALFYFAGHGMQMRGENFLLGLDAKLQSEFDVYGETISLNSVIDALERSAAVSLLFVDACRNNPMADRLNNGPNGPTRDAAPKGLAPVNATGTGTMIAFSASPGQLAFDGGGENSPFMVALLEHLASPSVEVGTAFKRVIRDVRERTGNLQSPQIVSNLATEFYFNAASVPEVSPPPASPPPPQVTVGSDITDLEFWRSIKDTNDVNLLRAYIVAFPRGDFIEVAKDRITKLEKPATPPKKIIKKTSKPKAATAPPPKPKAKVRTPAVADVKPAAPAGKSVATGGRCRDGNIERCRRNCREGRKGACAMLRRLEAK